MNRWSGPVEQTDYKLWVKTKKILKSHINTESNSHITPVNSIEAHKNEATVVHYQESPVLPNDLFPESLNSCELVADTSNK